MRNFTNLFRLSFAAYICLFSTNILAVTEIHVETAGTLSSLLTSTDKELKVTGVINGTDIKYIRSLVTAGTVTSLDWSEVRIVSGGDAYNGTNKTSNDIIGENMFYECSKLEAMVLPTTITTIQTNAFARTGLKAIDIPGSVTTIGGDAFAYCGSLETVVIGKKVKVLNQGVFYSSAVKTAYVKPVTPPSVPAYLFSSSPKIYVYTGAVADYKVSGWKDFGTIVGGLENYYAMEADPNTIAKTLSGNFFEDTACTQLKPECQAMSDEELTAAMTAVGMPELMITTALKVKNGTWAAYEQDFRIHSYKAYSDASYWNNKMMASGGSYMGNPTGIYAENDGDEIYVFVDADVPSDATLYFTGCVENQLIYSAQTGTRLEKGLNIIDGTKNALYYIVYTADTKSMKKTLSEWPEMKIHVEGGKVNGYYDVNFHTSTDFLKILRAAKLNRFTVRGGHSLYHLKTASFKQVFTTAAKMDKSIAWFDSVAVWEKNIMGMTEEVATGKKAGYPWYLTGGEAIYPLYYNNPNFAIEGEESDAGYANSVPYRTSYNSIACIRNCLDATNSQMDDWCAAHECGHNNQQTINVEGCTEASNNLFSNFVCYLGGLNSSNGSALSTVMNEFARHEPFYYRDVNSRLRFYWDLYLYYHLGQKNTSFYPDLFKALRKDPLSLYNTSNNNNGGLKFVRKVCEIAQEDLTEFFDIWGFFEPIKSGSKIEDYGSHPIAVTRANINSTKAIIGKYPVKNREIIFVEDRADYVLSTGFLQAAGKKRNGSDKVGQYGELGQFTSYLPGGCEPSEYVYFISDSLYAMEGTGGLGFLMLDAEGNLKYASNAKNICIPTSVGRDFTIYSYDADGLLREVTKAGSGTEYVELSVAGRLRSMLKNDQVIKLIVSGPINTTDINYMKQLINKENLQSIDLEQARTTSIANATFQNIKKLSVMRLPQTLTTIGSTAFSGSGLSFIEIPDKVTSVGGDAFAYCTSLTAVIIGKSVKSMDQGVFYGSGNIKEAYVKPLTPPTLNGESNYLFSGKNRTIHVYASALDAYKAANWERFGTLVGDLTDEMVDGIEEIQKSKFKIQNEFEGQENGAFYDLMGRRVTTLQPGTIYIRDGKKFMIK
ncbi:MAG: leucine-rich repeat protein [Bacteroidaceae bacterium]|nr:leucine-rich repeat protein [Bacteroidaceae bacterium]